MSVGDQNTKYDIDPKEFDKAINELDHHGVSFNTDFDIPYLAGTSQDGKIIYRDRKTPSGYKSKSNKDVNTDRYFKIHEHIEKILMDHGFPYVLAHQVATQLEYAAVKSDDHDIDEYDDKTQKMVQEAQIRKEYFVPPDLCMKPYLECHDHATIAKMHPVSKRLGAVAKRLLGKDKHHE